MHGPTVTMKTKQGIKQIMARFVILGMILILGTVWGAGMSYSQTPSAQEILERIDDRLYPDMFEMDMRMLNYDRPGHIQSQYAYHIQHREDIGSLMEITAPSSDQGRKILLKNNNMWMYIPGNSRTVRLAGSEDFMGSTFSNDDIMDADMSDDYNARVIENSQIPERFMLLDLQAKRSNVTYSRIQVYVWRESYIPAIMMYYSRSGERLKKMTFSNIQRLGGITRPTTLTMESLFEPGRKTVVQITSLQARSDINAAIFNERALVE